MSAAASIAEPLCRSSCGELNTPPIGAVNARFGDLFPPTRRQLQLLRFITGHIEAHGVSPTYVECGRALGIAAKSGIHRMVHALAERGHIRFRPEYPTSIQVLHAPAIPHGPEGAPLYFVPIAQPDHPDEDC